MGLELLHLSYVKRWVVAPAHREQSVAEHTFRVMVIARELSNAKYTDERGTFGMGLTEEEVVIYAMSHDAEELLTGDIPGPMKSAQAGYLRDITTMSSKQCLVKVADSIETGAFWLQWGNPGAWTGHPYNRAPARDIEKIEHYATKIPGLLEAAQQVWESITGKGMYSCLPSTKR